MSKISLVKIFGFIIYFLGLLLFFDSIYEGENKYFAFVSPNGFSDVGLFLGGVAFIFVGYLIIMEWVTWDLVKRVWNEKGDEIK